MHNKTKISDILSRDEIKTFSERSDAWGAWAVGSTWGVLALTFIGLAWARELLPWWGFSLALIMGVIIIAGRQLCFGILQHDAAHGTLFKNKWCNEVLVDWLCARPIWNELRKYRPYHLTHHAKTSTVPISAWWRGYPRLAAH